MSSWPPEIEREWGLSEVPVATMEEGEGATPRKTKYEA